jgi:hypothetical protein
MRRVTSESIVPAPTSTVHLVLDDFGRLGRAYREVDETHADADSLIECLLSGHYSDPARVIAFNLEEGWVRDVSAQVARALLARVGSYRLPDHVRGFVERHVVHLAY